MTPLQANLPAADGAQRGPLDGIRVLDLSNMLSGPYCTRLLADLGAEVIKVEPPQGDHNRGRRPVRDGHSRFFGHLNCGKKSVVLNLKTESGLAAALAIARQSDVVVENWRPGVAARLGLGYKALSALRPGVVYCSISGFGQNGPGAHRPAYAPIIHAASGFDLVQVEYQGGGKPQNTATYTADVFGGMSAFAAIQAALFHRERSGEGQYIDVALLDGMLNILVAECQEWQAPSDTESRVYPPLESSNGFIVIAPTSQKNFEALVKVVGHEEWLADPRFTSTVTREKHWAELMSLIEQWTRVHTHPSLSARTRPPCAAPRPRWASTPRSACARPASAPKKSRAGKPRDWSERPRGRPRRGLGQVRRARGSALRPRRVARDDARRDLC